MIWITEGFITHLDVWELHFPVKNLLMFLGFSCINLETLCLVPPFPVTTISVPIGILKLG